MNDVTVVDCDTHYWESVDVWEQHIDPAFRDRAPRLVQDGERLLVQVGETIYPSTPGHRGLGRTYGPDDTIHPQTLWDKEVSTDPARRLKFMDEQQTDVHIIFPTLGMVGFANIQDPALAAACSRAYNRFAADFASWDRVRLRPAMLVPFNHPEVAIEEMTWARQQGLTVAFANPTPPGPIRWSVPDYDLVWAAMADLGVTLAFHESALGAGPTTIGINRYQGAHSMLYLCAHTVEPQLALMDFILGGVLTRHRGLHVGLLEAHLSWLPGWLDLLDHIGDRYPENRLDDEQPSDVFRRQCFIAAFPDDVLVGDVGERIGDDNIVFSSDWPHKSLTVQRTSLGEFLARDDLSRDRKDRILAGSPALWMDLGTEDRAGN